jgi:dihydrofolate synthase/folylpolyglutamate synthase
MSVLGNTLGQIAGEKAGIIKSGIPVVSAPQQDEALLVLLRTIKKKEAPFTLVGRDLDVQPVTHTLEGQSFRILDGSKKLSFRIPLLGDYQLVNAATAYAALKASGLEVSEAAMREGFARVKWRARFEIARRDPPLIFDSAHNDDSFVRLREALQTYFPRRGVYLVFGCSEDKNTLAMLREMRPSLKRLILTRADHPRAMPVEALHELADQHGIPNETASPVSAALERALQLADADGSIVLTAGSMFVTAECMAAWERIRQA